RDLRIAVRDAQACARGDRLEQRDHVVGYVTLERPVVQIRHRLAISLGDIEHRDRAEPDQPIRVLRFTGLLTWVGLDATRSEDPDPVLTLAYLPAELLPRPVARDPGRIRPLADDQTHIRERVIVKRGPRAQPRGERLGVGHTRDGLSESFACIGTTLG